MPDLPEVTQTFDANVAPYLAGIEEMISATDDLKTAIEELAAAIEAIPDKTIDINDESVKTALADVEALHAAIDALPDEKTIRINVEQEGVPEAAAAGAEGAAPDTAGMAAEAAAADAAGDAADEADAKFQGLTEAEDASAAAAARNAAALEAERAAADDATVSAEEFFAVLDRLSPATQAAYEAQEAETGAIRDMASELGPAAESIDEVGLSYRQMVEQGILPADSALMGVAESTDAAATSFERVGAGVEAATIPFAAVGTAAKDAGSDLETLTADAAEGDAAFNLLGSAVTGIVNGFANLETTWQNTNVAWGLSLNALHWIVMGSMELLAVAVPAMVAFGAASLVAMQGVQEVGWRLQSSYTTTEALGDAFNTTGGQALGLAGNLQAAQDAADPQIWSLLGAGLRIVGEQSQSFVTMGSQVVTTLDLFAAKLTDDLNPAMSGLANQLDSLASKGVSDLTAFGQVFGNLGHFITNLATEMPGLAEVLLGAIAGFTKLLAVMTDPAWYNFNGNLVTIAMGIEEAWRWGNLLAPALSKVVTTLGSMSTGLGNAATKLSAFKQDTSDAETALNDAGTAAAAFGPKLDVVGTGAKDAETALDDAGEAASTGFGTKISSALSAAGSKIGTFVTGLTGIGTGAKEAETAVAGAGEAAAVAGEDAAESGVKVAGWRAAAATAGDAAKTFGSALASGAAILTGPWGWVIIGATAGLVLLGIQLDNIKTKEQAWVDSLEQSANAVKVSGTGFVSITDDLNKLGASFDQNTQAAAKSGVQINTTGEAFGRAAPYMSQTQLAAQAAAGGMTQVSQAGMNLVNAGAEVSTKLGISVPAAFSLLNESGLTVGQMFQKNGQLSQQALTDIENLARGYQVMAGNTSALGQNINAVNFSIGLQNTQVSKLNQAWDNYMSVVTGGTSSTAALNDDLQQMGNVANITGSKITALSGTTGLSVGQISQALTSFSGTSAQVWQNFDASLSQANTSLDWWRTSAAAGVTSGQQYSQAVATTAGQFLPYVKNSQAALAETMALSQEAGGPAYNATQSLSQNYQNLSNWVKQNGLSQSQYNNLLTQTTEQLANVSNAAQNFSQTLQSDIGSAVAAGSANLATITSDTKNLTTAMKDDAPASQQVTSAMSAWATQMVGTGANISTVMSYTTQLATDQGKTTTQAKTLANQMGALAIQIQTYGNDTSGTASARQALNSDIETLLSKAPTAANDIATLAKDIATQGSNSSAAEGARQQLITDLENAGVKAQTATGLVNSLTGAITKIPTSHTTNFNVQGTGTYAVSTSVVSGGIGAAGNFEPGAATGMRVPGYGGGDSVHIMVEPGETIVPKELTPAVAPLMAAHNVPGFAAGGIAGLSGAALPSGMGQWMMQELNTTIAQLTTLTVNTLSNVMKQAMAAAGVANIQIKPPTISNPVAYDQGGVLPPGLTMAYNGTGQPEQVVGPGGAGPSTIHVPIYIDGNKIAEAIVPYQSAAAGRYQLRNSGRTTGAWGTGWKT